ncbi:MAG: rhodanese-like domain-containing protein [Candidatus Marinimicrobia bacterium]|nr:rhodanese-like domain-containing protein [Candidatus Neomarinimicrobiota bacterium]MCF7851151.1 rhodanese-like domain-containing protein [Candidatus Neomarinimicrobiota bacterium]MCF7905516.1 rhodanese-like domain-containing protein [Candidatus Neomarinimicrobiota bacterium]
MNKLTKEAGSLIMIAGILGILAQFILPNGISLRTEMTTLMTESEAVAIPSVSVDPEGDLEAVNITLKDAHKAYLDSTALFLDARDPEIYAKGHIAGAINLPAGAFMDSLDYLESLDRDRLVISYCDGAECNASIDLASNLELMGFRQVRFFFGGWQEWIAAGYPTGGTSQ